MAPIDSGGRCWVRGLVGAEVRLSSMSATADYLLTTSASNVVAAVLGPYAAPLTASERNNAHRLVSRLVDGVGTPSPPVQIKIKSRTPHSASKSKLPTPRSVRFAPPPSPSSASNYSPFTSQCVGPSQGLSQFPEAHKKLPSQRTPDWLKEASLLLHDDERPLSPEISPPASPSGMPSWHGSLVNSLPRRNGGRPSGLSSRTATPLSAAKPPPTTSPANSAATASPDNISAPSPDTDPSAPLTGGTFVDGRPSPPPDSPQDENQDDDGRDSSLWFGSEDLPLHTTLRRPQRFEPPPSTNRGPKWSDVLDDIFDSPDGDRRSSVASSSSAAATAAAAAAAARAAAKPPAMRQMGILEMEPMRSGSGGGGGAPREKVTLSVAEAAALKWVGEREATSYSLVE